MINVKLPSNTTRIKALMAWAANTMSNKAKFGIRMRSNIDLQEKTPLKFMIYIHMYIHTSIDSDTDGWMDEWMDGLMDGWMDGWMDEWMDG